jgi:hypothetical protein
MCTTSPPPVTLLPCPHTGDLWLVAHGRLSPEDCEALAELLAEHARERRSQLPA